jgi:protein subunit release factor B
MVGKEKIVELEKRMGELGIHEDDLIEKFILGSGPGGQKINKTSSCVYLKHIPTGIEIKCQKERSRELNRYRARKDLCIRIEEIYHKEKSEKIQKKSAGKKKEELVDQKKKCCLKKNLYLRKKYSENPLLIKSNFFDAYFIKLGTIIFSTLKSSLCHHNHLSQKCFPMP